MALVRDCSTDVTNKSGTVDRAPTPACDWLSILWDVVIREP